MATFVPYLIALYCLSSVHAQLQMAIDRVDQASAVEDDLLLPRNTAECPVDGNNNLSPSCSKYNAQLLGGCFCKCGRPAGEKYTFFEPTNSCLKVSLARQRSECNLLFIGEKAESAITFIPSTGVTPKTINLPVNNSCSFYFGETLYAHYIGCDGAWREIPPNSVNESLEVTPGWNKNQLQFKTRDTATSFLRKNPGRIFRVAVQCRQQRENRDVVANSTCVMFKVHGRILCPIPQKTPLNQSATLPPPTVEIFSTTDLPPGPTTAQAENITTGTPAVVTNTSSPIPQKVPLNQSATLPPPTVEISSTTDLPPSPTTAQAENITTGTSAVVTNTSSLIPKQNSSNQSVTSGPETVKITSITGLPPSLASNKANSIKTDTPAKVTSEVTTSKMETPGEDRTQQAIDITTPITIPENKGTVLNCTKDRFDGKHEWSRKDGEPAVTTTRILTEDTRLNITDASVEDAGEYICRNGPTVTHRFVVTVEVFVKVQMIVKVLNYEYTPELQNKSSPAYKATEKNFTAEMDKLYKNTPGYVRTEVLNFTKGSVNVDFRVIIVINAIDPKNASAIPDAKAETTHQVVREAKTGFVKQLQVSPVVEVFSPPLEPRGIEIFEEKSDKLGVRWEPSEDADAFKVQSYHVQYRELLTKIPQNASVPSTEKKDTYSYLIKDLEPKTTYMIRVGAENRHGINFNEERAHKTLAPPFAEWIIVLIVLGILLVTGIIVGLIVFTRRRAEQRRKKLKEEEDGRFGGLSGDVRLASVPNYETRNVKGIKFSFANKSFMPSEANWKEIPYEKITLMNELGSGAFGVVYKGELKQDNGNVTPCAVKTLKESATTEEIRDLYNELEIMTNVGYHPNLVNLLGACTQDGPLLVVIEIAENGNLLELLRKSRETNQNYGNIQGTVLTSDTRLRIAADVAKGMAHLANGRWIHRDLAARNVLLAKNYVAKVADYGMARDIYEQLMYKKETQGKLPVKWMAIESLETYIFTTESDVWSYGVLLWEMESGGLKPYAGLSTTELIDQLKKGYRLEKPDGCSDAVYQIMRDCWNPNPKSRPTFDDLVTRLENMAVSS